jgi:hypothetical protein
VHSDIPVDNYLARGHLRPYIFDPGEVTFDEDDLISCLCSHFSFDIEKVSEALLGVPDVDWEFSDFWELFAGDDVGTDVLSLYGDRRLLLELQV